MRAPVVRVAEVLALALIAAACRTKSTERPAPHGSASASVTSVGMVPPPLPPTPESADVALCRVIDVRSNPGTSDGGAAPQGPAIGTALDGRDWLELGANTEVVLRHATTTRELALRGPGRFLACFQGTETVIVASGEVKTTAGAGSRAGAEVILGTPFGTLHFADASLDLRVGERALDVAVEAGVVTFVPAAGKKATADAGSPDVVLGPKSKKRLAGNVDAKELVARCGEASSSIATAPPTLAAGAPSARALLGRWSVDQLRARQAARWACASARAAAGRQQDSEGNALSTEINALDKVWQPSH